MFSEVVEIFSGQVGIISVVLNLLSKNKCGNLSDSNNYGPIALTTIMFKLFESTILLKCEMFLDTCPNQFGFKNEHSTDMCIYICTKRDRLNIFKIVTLLYLLFYF